MMNQLHSDDPDFSDAMIPLMVFGGSSLGYFILEKLIVKCCPGWIGDDDFVRLSCRGWEKLHVLMYGSQQQDFERRISWVVKRLDRGGADNEDMIAMHDVENPQHDVESL